MRRKLLKRLRPRNECDLKKGATAWELYFASPRPHSTPFNRCQTRSNSWPGKYALGEGTSALVPYDQRYRNNDPYFGIRHLEMPPGEIPAKEFPKDSVACYLSGLLSTHPAISLLPLPSNPWSSLSALTVVLPTAKALGSLDDSPWGLAPVAQVISPSSASFSPRAFRPGAALPLTLTSSATPLCSDLWGNILSGLIGPLRSWKDSF